MNFSLEAFVQVFHLEIITANVQIKPTEATSRVDFQFVKLKSVHMYVGICIRQRFSQPQINHLREMNHNRCTCLFLETGSKTFSGSTKCGMFSKRLQFREIFTRSRFSRDFGEPRTYVRVVSSLRVFLSFAAGRQSVT